MSADPTQLADGIAVIGMAGRFPGAPDLATYWHNLLEGVESITHFAPEELDVPPSVLANPNYVRARGMMEGADLFDADFFNMLPREADYTDPQHRLLLETAWTALEDAAVDPSRFAGSIGVFAGCSLNSYLLHNLASNPGFLAEFVVGQQMSAHPSLVGNDKDFIATRLSYKLNLRGPSVAVQCACSTSLVAICQAAQSLLGFQCDVAIAGGVSVTFPQKRGYLHEDGSLVSGDGTCRPFDAAAGGTVFGDGVGVVVLKRADEALRDGDPIHAIIRGFAVNNDGSGKVSYMAPSVDGQAEAIATAHALAGIDVNTIRYVEAHGTGTSLGDPIEVAALTRAFRANTQANQFCALGAAKGNIGHLEVASGVAGLLKAILVLKHGEIPPTLHFSAPNPRIDFATTPFYVAARRQPWPEAEEPRRAGVSSFGVGGTNAHLVLEQAPVATMTSSDSTSQILVLSAKTPDALDAATRNLADYLRAQPDLPLNAIAHTLQSGRRAFAHRRACLIGHSITAADVLSHGKPGRIFTGTSRDDHGVAFLFPGQGAQRVDMGRELYDSNPVFRAEADRCCELLEPELGLDLRDVLYPAAGADLAKAGHRLMQTSLTQPALFVVEYALAQAWLALGVRPKIMVGHSLGEYVAATLAGVFTLPDALHLLAVRGRLMQSLPSGAMLAVALGADKIAGQLTPGTSVAASNGPSSCVVSGPQEAVDAFAKSLLERGIVSKELKTSHAFHSDMMDPILAEFEAEVARVPRRAPSLPIVSSLHGRLGTAEEWTAPSYWSAQLRQTVRFSEAIGVLLAQPELALLEVGPGQTLTALSRQNPAWQQAQPVIASSPRTCKDPETDEFLAAIAQLWVHGVKVDWAGLRHGPAPQRLSLPGYAFQRKRHWIEPHRSTPTPVELDFATNGMNGNGAHEANGHVPSSAVEALIDEQLQIMARQIDVLRHHTAGGHVA